MIVHSNAFAEKLLATKLVYAYGGPETKMDCTETVRLGPVVTCSQYTTFMMQHTLYIEMWGPDSLNVPEGTLKTVSDVCLAKAIAEILASASMDLSTAIIKVNDKLDSLQKSVENYAELVSIVGQVIGVHLTTRAANDWKAI